MWWDLFPVISVCNEGKKVIENSINNFVVKKKERERDWEHDKEMHKVISREKTLVNITSF